MEHMESIFSEFENWYQNGTYGGPGEALSHAEIEQLQEWLRKLEHDFQATLACRRWRFGSAMARILMRLAFRPQGPLVTDHMQDIFNDFRQKTKFDEGPLHSQTLARTEQSLNEQSISTKQKKEKLSQYPLCALREHRQQWRFARSTACLQTGGFRCGMPHCRTDW